MAAPINLVNLPVSCDAISWSEDNRIAIATPKCVTIFSLQCDPSEQNGNFVFNKSIIKSHAEILEFDVSIDFETLDDEERQNRLMRSILTDRTLSPPTSDNCEDINFARVISSRNGLKLVRWSPAGTRQFDSVILACLALDHRLNVYKRTSKKGNMTMIVDLSLLLGKLLSQRGYAHVNEEPHPDLPAKPSLEARCVEFKRRVYMLAAVTLDWSGTFRPAPALLDQADGVSHDEAWELDKESYRLLAVAMKSGHVVIWKLPLHLESEEDVSIYSVFDSGYQWPVSLAWYREPTLQTTGQSTKAWLAVGDTQGRVSVWSHRDDNQTTLPTFAKRLDVWAERDLISVCQLAWTQAAHKEELSSVATLVVTKGLFLIVFLVDLCSMTVVRYAHNSGKNPIPPDGSCVSGSMVLTTSSFGETHRTIVDWTKSDGVMKTDVVEPFNPNCKNFGLAISPHGVFVAKPITHRVSKKVPPRLLNFCTLGKMETVAAELLEYHKDLSKKTDLLEFLRQNFHNTGDRLPRELESVAEGESAREEAGRGQGGAHSHTLRLRRFLLLMKTSKADGGGAGKDTDGENRTKEQIVRMESDIPKIERELRESHFLASLQSWQQMPAKGVGDNAISHTTALLLMADWLSTSIEGSDEPIKTLVTGVYKSNPHETEVGRRETCDLCDEIIPFNSIVSDACPNGHRWTRCQLSLQLCQTTAKTRECVQCSTIALPAQDRSGSAWLRRVLRQCCPLCSSMFV